MAARFRAKNRMRRLFEHHSNFRTAGAQAFARAQIKGGTGPTPIPDMGFQSQKAFAERARIIHILAIVFLTVWAGILPPHNMMRWYGVQGSDHLQLFIAHRIGIELCGRLHRDQA